MLLLKKTGLGSGIRVSAPLGFDRPPAAFLQRQPQLAGVVAAHVPAGLQQRRRPRQRPTAIDEVPGVLTPALRIPVKPRRAGGLGVLNPRLLPHRLLASTSVLANADSIGKSFRGTAFCPRFVRGVFRQFPRNQSGRQDSNLRPSAPKASEKLSETAESPVGKAFQDCVILRETAQKRMLRLGFTRRFGYFEAGAVSALSRQLPELLPAFTRNDPRSRAAGMGGVASKRHQGVLRQGLAGERRPRAAAA